jgi:hypothetical protein
LSNRTPSVKFFLAKQISARAAAWSWRGLVRCAGFNGKFGYSFGQLFQIVDPASELARAA